MDTPRTPARRGRAYAALFGLAALAAASSAFAVPSTQLTLTGQIDRPGVYDLTALQGLPATTQTVSYLSGSGSQTHSYAGTSLWGLIDQAGVQTNPSVHNDLLNRIVVATGSDGYRSVFALGELSPNFGNRQSIVAYGEVAGGVTQPLGADGFARVTSPGDIKGGRYVSNLVNLDVRGTGSQLAGVGGGLSTSFTVTGAVLQPMTFDLDALQALPSMQVTSGSTVYTGVSLWDLLFSTVGLATDPSVKNDVLGMYVVATGSDGYKAAFSLGELSPDFGNQPDIIAYAFNGQPLDTNGFARVVAPNDVRAGRAVSNLIGLEVFRAAAAAQVPEPGSWALLAAGSLWFVFRRPRVRSHRSSMPVAA